ncbi:hypothetical protein Ddc_08913 [Ditylenchus destructor]|nr:hypothetical protein Ddc_08913 [Ditylenchus destructor]
MMIEFFIHVSRGSAMNFPLSYKAQDFGKSVWLLYFGKNYNNPISKWHYDPEQKVVLVAQRLYLAECNLDFIAPYSLFNAI